MKILYTLSFNDKGTYEKEFTDTYEGRLWLNGVMSNGIWLTISPNERYWRTPSSIQTVRVQENY
jgi:hypothetical protein